MSEVLLHHVECGPVQLLNSAPTPATVLASLPGPDGAAQLCVQLATPVKHRLPAAASDADYPPGQLGRDAHGPFLWIYYAALHPRVPGIDPPRRVRRVLLLGRMGTWERSHRSGIQTS